MELHSLKPNKTDNRSTKRLGRGIGSHTGKTAGKGHKGIKARAGHAIKRGFEGGQMPLYRRLPKRGFKNNFAVKVRAINIKTLGIFDDGAEVSPEILRKMGLFPNGYEVLKILGEGEIDKKLTIKAHKFSKSAREKLKNCKLEEI